MYDVQALLSYCTTRFAHKNTDESKLTQTDLKLPVKKKLVANDVDSENSKIEEKTRRNILLTSERNINNWTQNCYFILQRLIMNHLDRIDEESSRSSKCKR
jgi:hypothetical protein